jgi:hypothetical protein
MNIYFDFDSEAAPAEERIMQMLITVKRLPEQNKFKDEFFK